MTYQELVDRFKEEVLPFVVRQYEQDGRPDYPARREAWNDWTDMLCRFGEISDDQYDNWCLPDELDRKED